MNKGKQSGHRRSLFTFWVIGVLLLGGWGCGPVHKPAKTLEGRLFCAARSAYGIQPGKPFFREQPAFGGAGWKADPAIFQGGPGGIHACLVGETLDGIVIAFRGTIPPKEISMPTFLDWINNLWKSPLKSVKGYPGTFHSGFWEGVEVLWVRIVEKIHELDPSGTQKVYFTGHSKGGAMAQIGAIRLEKEKGVSPEKILTFASPKVMNEAAVTAFSHLPVTRYENDLDLIPYLAPDGSFIALCAAIPGIGEDLQGGIGWDYEDLGQTLHIRPDGKVEPPSFLGGIKEAGRLVKELARGVPGLIHLVDAHKSECGSGYWQGLCPDLPCPR